LIKTLRELGVRKRQFPHYENQWQDQIRAIQRKTNPKHAEENPVDHPIAELGDYDDQELAQLKIDPAADEFGLKVVECRAFILVNVEKVVLVSGCLVVFCGQILSWDCKLCWKALFSL
jgi:hypothetical protein